jgi:hypothetical protein
MYTITEILEHLSVLPDEFAEHYAAGKYAWAAMDYEHAVLVSKFIRMDEEARNKLLEQFNQDEVEKCFKESGRWEDADRAADGKTAV